MKRVVTGVSGLLFAFSPAMPLAAAQGGAAAVGGVVRDLHGAPQLGALVELLSPDATVVAQTYTDDHGRYALTAISPGQYALRVSGAFLMPSLRSHLLLNPGMRALANLTMTAMVEVGAWFPTQKRGLDEPSDDWRWNLRSTANRPLLRLDDQPTPTTGAADQDSQRSLRTQLAVFSRAGAFAESGTHQVFTLERAGTGERWESFHADISQASASTSMEVHAEMERGTALGGTTRMVAGFSSHPELTVGNGESGLQVLTFGSSEKMVLGDAVLIDAGTLLSAERLIQSRVSAAPYLRIVVTPATGLAVMYRYATSRAVQSSDDLDTLQTLPQVLSDGQGRPFGAKDTHQEVSLARNSGRDQETFSVYQDDLPVAAIAGMGRTGTESFAGLPFVSDLGSDTFRLAVKGYTARGVNLSWTHQVNPELTTSVALELGSALEREGGSLSSDSLEQSLQPHFAPAIRATVQGSVARSGTRYRLQYRWQPDMTLDTVDAFNVAADQAYLSCSLKQKLWAGHHLRGLDAVLEATNLLEEGYQPMVGPDGRTLILAQVPRSMQAGLSFSF